MKDNEIYVSAYFDTIEFIIPRREYHKYLGDDHSDDERSKYMVRIVLDVPAMHIFYLGERQAVLPDGSDAEGPVWSTHDVDGEPVYTDVEIYEFIIDMLFAKLQEVRGHGCVSCCSV